MARNPLSCEEREEIRDGIVRGDTNTEIARVLGRAVSCVGREIARNCGRSRYRAVAAQRRADREALRPKLTKFERDPELADHVVKRLRAKDSPMTISREMAASGLQARVSHETIYAAIQKRPETLQAGLHEHLHLRRRRRRRQAKNRANTAIYRPLGILVSIHDRPEIALERTEIGHLEGDLIVGAGNRSAIVTLFDRCSRSVWLARLNESKTKDCVYRAMLRTLRRIPEQARTTLTWDQGSEMVRWRELVANTGIDMYFADRCAPWQRPTNENGNALIRRYVGKGTDLSTFTTRDLRKIEHRLNTMPRRSLNWQNANHVYNAQLLAMTG